MVTAARGVGSRSRSRNAFQRDEGSEPEGAIDDGSGHFRQREVVIARVLPQGRKRFIHCHLTALRNDALGLLDQNSGIEGVLQLLRNETLSRMLRS